MGLVYRDRVWRDLQLLPAPRGSGRVSTMQQRPAQQPWWRSLAGVVTLCVLAAAGLFFIGEHTSHVFSALPYLLIAACPLMHLFMHHGHHGSHGPSGGSDR